MSYRVVANAGFVSRSMSKRKANEYRRQLELLGNYNVKIMKNHEAEEYLARSRGGDQYPIAKNSRHPSNA